MSEDTTVNETNAPPEVPSAQKKSGSKGLRILLKTVGVLCGLVLVLAIIGYLLPSTYAVEQSVVIEGKPVDFHEQVNDLRNWPKWTAWSKEHDPETYGDLEIEYSETTTGKGATQTWTDPHAGEGRLEITDADPETGVRFTLEFDGTPSRGSIQYYPTETGTKVVWRLRGECGDNPVNRWMAVLCVKKMIQKDYEIGLNKLKEIAEEKAAKRIEWEKELAAKRKTEPPMGAPQQIAGPGEGGPPGGGRGRKRRGAPRDPQAIVTRIMQNDKNKDGKLSKDEMSERARGRFDSWDENKDGFVDQEELKKAVASFGQRGRGGRKKRPGGARPGSGGETERKRPPLEGAGEKAKKTEKSEKQP